MSPFFSPYVITQVFGARPEYYRKYALDGHEGIDLIPAGSDWRVRAVEGGEIVRWNSIGAGTPYGKYLVVLNWETRRAWWYCHLASLDMVLQMGVPVLAGTVLGVMGATGNTQGAHLHLGLRESDGTGMALHLDNGYHGFINPLPVLEKLP